MITKKIFLCKCPSLVIDGVKFEDGDTIAIVESVAQVDTLGTLFQQGLLDCVLVHSANESKPVEVAETASGDEPQGEPEKGNDLPSPGSDQKPNEPEANKSDLYSLGFTDKLVDDLAKSSITSIAQLKAYVNGGGQLEKLPAMGKNRVTVIREALAKLEPQL